MIGNCIKRLLFARVEFPKLVWTGRFAVHGEGNENTKDAGETSV
jgi:hypothetical protein